MAVLGATSLTGCNSIPSFLGGTSDTPGNPTKMIFRNATSPVNWTKATTVNQGMLRVITSSVLSPSGSLTFPQVFQSSKPFSGSLSTESIIFTVNSASAYPTTSVTTTPGGFTVSSQPFTITSTELRTHSHPYASPATTPYAQFATPDGPFANQASTTILSDNTDTTYSPAPPYVNAYSGSGPSHSHSATLTHIHTFSTPTSIQHNHSISSSHSHTVSASIDFNLAYVDMIIATKN